MPERILGLAFAFVVVSGSRLLAGEIEYNRDVRPILSEACFACHGPDSAARKADLRLDRRDDAMTASALVPGKPEESEALRRILSTDPEEVMPPPSSHKEVTEAQKEILRRWIAEGANYQPHWSLIAPRRPNVPAVKNAPWPRNPIDNFVLARLESAGLTPAPEADRHVLARRASLDLTGMPPTPEEVERFVKDPSPTAYEDYLDRLLAKQEWGEHRGRFWLDYARYADTHGIHFDNYREMWAYRDWVIKAFNQNMPFNEFTIENLAGDLLPNRTLDQQIASGFNRCNMTTNEGGVIPEEYLVLYTRDRTETTSAVWLGITANCSTCHDHKFDPLSQREFYEMAAFFNNTTQGAMDLNIKDTPPVVFVPDGSDRQRFAKIDAMLNQAKQELEQHDAGARGAFDAWRTTVSPAEFSERVPTEGQVFHAPLSEGADGAQGKLATGGESLTLTATAAWEPGFVANHAYKATPGLVLSHATAGDFEKDQAFTAGAWVKLPADNASGSILARMDEDDAHRGWDLWVEGGRIGSHIIHRWPEDALKVISKQKLKGGIWHHVMLVHAGNGKADGLSIYIDGKKQEVDVAADALKSTIKTSTPLKFAQRSRGARIDNLTLQDVRLYNRAIAAKEVANLAAATRAVYLTAKPAEQRSPQETDELFKYWLTTVDPVHRRLEDKVTRFRTVREFMEKRGTVAHVMQEKTTEPMAFILARGEYDKRKDEVKADTPDFLPPFPADQPRNRLGFANWLLADNHPLTARVTVNRFWQEVFGTGLVRTSNDFGVAGELPSHPELLDWLAIEFRENGWDVKRFFKLLLTSATYRQAAIATPEKIEKDNANRLLSRGPRFRMDAEMVRDQALKVSGLLIPKIGGPSVRPYQPPGVWEAVAMIGSNTRDYKQDAGEKLYRRSMYTFWKRAAPPASMEILNAPSREVCTVRRERTNTPIQALVTLNDPQFVEAAKVLAEKTLKSSEEQEARMDFLGMRLLSRSFTGQEKDVIRASLADLSAYYAAHPDNAKELLAVGETKADPSTDASLLASWTMLTNQLMNLDEFLNK
ncbi:MAG: DUF1553 domain-containing protein [Planctomycetota bacterium]